METPLNGYIADLVVTDGNQRALAYVDLMQALEFGRLQEAWTEISSFFVEYVPGVVSISIPGWKRPTSISQPRHTPFQKFSAKIHESALTARRLPLRI